MRGLQVATVGVSANHTSAVLRAHRAKALGLLWLAAFAAAGACGGRAEQVPVGDGTRTAPNAVPNAQGTGGDTPRIPSSPPPNDEANPADVVPPSGWARQECDTANARTGGQCTQDCAIACGFQRMGTKVCTCEEGVYISCPCPRPQEYLGSPYAEVACPSSDGTAAELDDTPCDTEWDQCIGTDLVTGTTPRGCACLVSRDTGALQWFCGSTNRWFNPVP